MGSLTRQLGSETVAYSASPGTVGREIHKEANFICAVGAG